MGKNGMPGEEAETVQALRVRAPEPRKGVAMLPVAFGAVRLNVTARGPADLGKARERGIRAARNELWA